MTVIPGSFEERMAAEDTIVLGDDCCYTKSTDREGNWIAIVHWHQTKEGKLCAGWIPFNVEHEYILPGTPTWDVESYEPLTMSPSLLCDCGNHGFIREGKWVPC